MAIFEIKRQVISRAAETSFEAVGLKERDDLQRLLRDQIDVIAPEGVLILTDEFGDWADSKRRIDLLGLDKSANLVVFELKRNEDVHMELQAVRYAAMISTMTLEKAVETHATFRSKASNRGKEKGNEQSGLADDSNAIARKEILEFLGWEIAREDEFGQDVRIVLVAPEFSKELTTTVLWLNNRGLDVRCVRIKPYKLEDRLLMDVQQLIPLPEAATFIEQVGRKKQEEQRDRNARSGGDKPVSFLWKDAAGQRQEVTNWRSLLEIAATKAISMNLPPDDLPMKWGDSREKFEEYDNPIELRPGLYIKQLGSAETIRGWISKMFVALKREPGFLEVETKSGRIFKFPE